MDSRCCEYCVIINVIFGYICKSLIKFSQQLDAWVLIPHSIFFIKITIFQEELNQPTSTNNILLICSIKFLKKIIVDIQSVQWKKKLNISYYRTLYVILVWIFRTCALIHSSLQCHFICHLYFHTHDQVTLSS